MRRTGFAELALVRGGVPHYNEMVKLGKTIVTAIVEEYGTHEFIKRMSNPLFFQSLACAMAFEWDTSGSTTVTLSALRQALSKENIGIKVIGGKGKKARQTKNQIIKMGDEFGLHEKKVQLIQHVSKLSPKVDSSALQDSFSVYFHSLLMDEKGNYSIIDQGMNLDDQTARRYHWLSNIKQFVNGPHNAIVGNVKKDIVLDLTDKISRECRKSIVDIVNDQRPEKIQTMLLTIRRLQKQRTLSDFIRSRDIRIIKLPEFLKVPTRINKNALRIAKGEISGFQDLLSIKGIGPATIRGLAYISGLIYGAESSWKDPVSYSFSHGTKSGKPYYVNKELMKSNAEILLQALEEAKIGKKEKLDAIKRLNRFI